MLHFFFLFKIFTFLQISILIKPLSVHPKYNNAGIITVLSLQTNCYKLILCIPYKWSKKKIQWLYRHYSRLTIENNWRIQHKVPTSGECSAALYNVPSVLKEISVLNYQKAVGLYLENLPTDSTYPEKSRLFLNFCGKKVHNIAKDVNTIFFLIKA